jgi:hypothetical protein
MISWADIIINGVYENLRVSTQNVVEKPRKIETNRACQPSDLGRFFRQEMGVESPLTPVSNQRKMMFSQFQTGAFH